MNISVKLQKIMKRLIAIILLIQIPILCALAEDEDNFHLTSVTTTPRVLSFIKESYIDQARVKPFEMLKGALNQIQKNVAEILVAFDGGNKFSITIDKATKKFSPKELFEFKALWPLLNDIYTFIEVHYHGDVKKQDIEYLAIDGILTTLDPHSNILPPKIYNEFKIGTTGKFGGIGIVIGTKEGELTVISPIEDTPAWRAGIKAGDKIIQIGEESTVNMSLTEAVELLRGDVGTTAVVTIDRKGKPAPFNVTLKRAIIKIESVQSAVIPVGNKNVGYLKIKSFQEDTEKEFIKQVAKLKESQNFSGLILDLRNDPGGLLSQAVAIADKFISEGVIVSTVGAGNVFLEQESAKSAGTEPAYPLVVIVNEGSASASEIVAGTLQNYGRAIIVGTQTFGKGSVQTVYDLRDGSALKITIAEYLTAGKNSIQSIGVTPDIKLVAARIGKDAIDLVEDKHETEESLEGHLAKNSGMEGEDSEYKLNYFEPYVEESDEEISKREYSSTLDFSKDFPVKFASSIIAKDTTDSYKDLLKAAVPVLESESKEQENLISTELTKYGITWGDCKQGGRPTLQMSFSLEKNNEQVKRVAAGDEITMTLIAKNIGTGSLCRLVGITDSKEHYLKNKEFVFGSIEPQASKKYSVKIKVPKYISTQNLPFTVKFNEANANQPNEFKAIIPVVGLPEPQFAYSFKLETPENIKVSREALPFSKSIPLKVDVKNTGKGAAPNAVAIIKATDAKGIFIDVGRIKLGKIDPNQSKSALFKFKIEEALPKTAFELELTIIDQDLLTSVSDKIEFTVPSGVSNPPARQWHEAPKISMSNLNPPVSTNTAKFTITGNITDDQEVKDYFIFVNEDKVAYSSNPDATPNYPISAELPLKEGNNMISIVARDNQEMAVRYSFVVERR